MGRIIPYIERNVNGFETADYILLAAVALAVLFSAVILIRGLYRLLFRKKKASVIPQTGDPSSYREVSALAQAEKRSIDYQLSRFNETFTQLRPLYDKKLQTGARPEELIQRMFSFTHALRNASMQLVSMINTYLLYEHARTLLGIYKHIRSKDGSADAPTPEKLENRLNAVREKHIVPVLISEKQLAPDPDKYFFELTVPQPKDKPTDDAGYRELIELYDAMRTYLDAYSKSR